jgi:hypothetical protein
LDQKEVGKRGHADGGRPRRRGVKQKCRGNALYTDRDREGELIGGYRISLGKGRIHMYWAEENRGPLKFGGLDRSISSIVAIDGAGGEQQRRGGAGEEAPTADGAPRHVQIFGPERPPFLASPPLPLILTSQIFLILCFYFFQVW